MTEETYSFQAEINQLLSLIINTFYTNKDIFLRELISNASDALDKAKYRRSQNEVLSGDFSSHISEDELQQEYCIRIHMDQDAKQLYIDDTGIGMTKQELIDNLGTIAQSGTKGFMQKMADTKNVDSLIGQFGVGFYSAYLVADRVVVTSRTSDGCFTWASNATGTFTITEHHEDSVLEFYGTRLLLQMKDDSHDYLDHGKLNNLIMTYSQFIQYPIYMKMERIRDVPVEENEEQQKQTDTQTETQTETHTETQAHTEAETKNNP